MLFGHSRTMLEGTGKSAHDPVSSLKAHDMCSTFVFIASVLSAESVYGELYTRLPCHSILIQYVASGYLIDAALDGVAAVDVPNKIVIDGFGRFMVPL